MRVQEAKKIIEEECLKNYNLYESRRDRENEVVIKYFEGKWIVYVTDERASTISNSVDEYYTESEALYDFIERLRADKILREL